tara:strand:- start:409 stop:537 length:129 start_codon:yes stop_codon:yes gene_type:complete
MSARATDVSGVTTATLRAGARAATAGGALGKEGDDDGGHDAV